jgi:hypothetical protein
MTSKLVFTLELVSRLFSTVLKTNTEEKYTENKKEHYRLKKSEKQHQLRLVFLLILLTKK